MKKSTTTQRFAVAIALLFVTGSYAHAQFGGLLNAAKKKAKDAVTKTVNGAANKQTDPQQNIASVTASDGDVPFYYESGNPLGVWHAKTRTFERYAKDDNGNRVSQSYTFKEEGPVMFQDGTCKGEILADGTMNSTKTQDIHFDKATGQVQYKGEWIGKVDDYGSAYICNEKMIHGVQPIDKEIVAYILFNMIATNELLAEYKQKYNATVKENEAKRKQQIAELNENAKRNPGGNAQPNATANRNTGGNATKLWKGGSVAGEIRSNDEVWIGGSNRGRFESNGDIRVGGSIAGQILSDGQIRKGGSIVGKVQNGSVWLGGSIVGEIRQNGDVVKKGSIVGRAENMRDARKVAVIYFFNFFVF